MSLSSYENQALEYKPVGEDKNPCSVWEVEKTPELRIKSGVLQQKCVIKYKYQFEVKMSGLWTKYGEIEAWLSVPVVEEEYDETK